MSATSEMEARNKRESYMSENEVGEGGNYRESRDEYDELL